MLSLCEEPHPRRQSQGDLRIHRVVLRPPSQVHLEPGHLDEKLVVALPPPQPPPPMKRDRIRQGLAVGRRMGALASRH